jgi:2,4'-dihydroxyacetophenone dioxygenase
LPRQSVRIAPGARCAPTIDTTGLKHMTQTTTTSSIRPDDSLHVRDPQHLPWVRWALPGAHFKLLSADPGSGRFTLMIRLEKGCVTPRHRHVGAVEGLVLEGGFHYIENPNERYTAGMYLLEPAGCVHQPVSPEGAVMFAVFHGPVEGINGDGMLTGRVDCAWHIATWNAAMNDR